MNLTETRKNMLIAKQQAEISINKSKYWDGRNAPFKALMYKIRYQALSQYVVNLQKKIRNNERKQYKKANK